MNHEVRLPFHLSIIGKMSLLCIVIENIFPKGLLQDDFPFPCGLQIISKKWGVWRDCSKGSCTCSY
jgi:hypothetical protein